MSPPPGSLKSQVARSTSRSRSPIGQPRQDPIHKRPIVSMHPSAMANRLSMSADIAIAKALALRAGMQRRMLMMDSVQKNATLVSAQAGEAFFKWFCSLSGPALEKAIGESFKKFDSDGSGSIDRKEFERALYTMGMRMREDEYDALFTMVDKDGSGTVDQEEFTRMVKKYMKGDEQSGHGGSGEGGGGDAEETSNGDQHSQNQKRWDADEKPWTGAAAEMQSMARQAAVDVVAETWSTEQDRKKREDEQKKEAALEAALAQMNTVLRDKKQIQTAIKQFEADMAKDASVLTINQRLQRHVETCDRGCTHLAPLSAVGVPTDCSMDTHQCVIMSHALEEICDNPRYTDCPVGEAMNNLVRNFMQEEDKVKAELSEFKAALSTDLSMSYVNELLQQHINSCARGCKDLAPLIDGDLVFPLNWNTDTHLCLISESLETVPTPRCPVATAMNAAVRELYEYNEFTQATKLVRMQSVDEGRKDEMALTALLQKRFVGAHSYTFRYREGLFQSRHPSKKSPRSGSEACIPITRREETLMRGHKRAISEHEASKVFPEVHLSSPRPKQILNSDVAPMQRLTRKVIPFLPLEEVEGDRMTVTVENRLQFVTSRGRMKMSREEAYELGRETSPRFVAPRHRRVPCTDRKCAEIDKNELEAIKTQCKYLYTRLRELQQLKKRALEHSTKLEGENRHKFEMHIQKEMSNVDDDIVMTAQLISKCTEELVSMDASLRTKNRVDRFVKCGISPCFPASELDMHRQASEEHNLFGERVGLAPRTPRSFHVDTWRAPHTHEVQHHLQLSRRYCERTASDGKTGTCVRCADVTGPFAASRSARISRMPRYETDMRIAAGKRPSTVAPAMLQDALLRYPP